MNATIDSGENRTESLEQSPLKYYLPAVPQLSSAPSVLEKAVTKVFRRRGTWTVVVSDDDRAQ